MVLAGTDTSAVTGTDVPVVVPAGAWRFTVSEPTTDLPADVEGGAADGTGFIGIA